MGLFNTYGNPFTTEFCYELLNIASLSQDITVMTVVIIIIIHVR